jgi:nitrogen fixation protein FixH
MTTAPITGRKVFIFTASAFGVIIAVNLVMAYMAVSTFPGLETKNSYVASQSFDEDRAAQLALQWTVAADVEGDALVLSITDQAGVPVEVAALEATFGRATHVNDDMTPEFTFVNGRYVAPVDVGPGNWNLRMLATADDGTKFRQRVVVYIRPKT